MHPNASPSSPLRAGKPTRDSLRRHALRQLQPLVLLARPRVAGFSGRPARQEPPAAPGSLSYDDWIGGDGLPPRS